MTAEDQKPYDAISRPLEKAGSASTTGERIGALNPIDIPDPGRSIDYPTASTVLLVAQEPDNVAMYLRPLSAVVPRSRRCEEILSVNLGLEGTGKRYQLFGWSDSESTYIWTNGSGSQLEFRPLPAGRQFVLRLVGNPFISKPHLAHQRIGLAINNEMLGDFKIDDIAVVETEIPPHIAGSGRPVRVTLRLYDAARPATYGDPNDDRTLAFRYIE